MTTIRVLALFALLTTGLVAHSVEVESVLTPFGSRNPASVELKNDGYVESGSNAYVQMGFVKGEKAGVWVKIPANIPLFKVEIFRVLIAAPTERGQRLQAFFHMGLSGDGKYSPAIPREIENAVELTAGPYWNDIPAVGTRAGNLRCAKAGDLVGAALEFTHDGVPSVFRDGDGLSNPLANTLFAIPGGWNFSQTFGLTGDWILRIVGRSATASECL